MANIIAGAGPEELKALHARLKTEPKAFRRDLHRELRDALDPVADKVRESILDMRAEHSAAGTLRGEVAETVYVSLGTVSLSIVSDGGRMPNGKETLPAHLDSEHGWSHPVFARGERFRLAPSRARKYRSTPKAFRPLVKRGRWAWVRQMGKPRWFEQPVIDSHDDLRRACEQAMDKCRRRIEGHG